MLSSDMPSAVRDQNLGGFVERIEERSRSGPAKVSVLFSFSPCSFIRKAPENTHYSFAERDAPCHISETELVVFRAVGSQSFDHNPS